MDYGWYGYTIDNQQLGFHFVVIVKSTAMSILI